VPKKTILVKIMIMKSSLVLGYLLFALVKINAQGTLQFNQVKLLNSSETVPAGKVWKVEGLSYNGGNVFNGAVTYTTHVFGGNRGFDGFMRFQVNGESIVIPAAYVTSANGIATAIPNYTFPMWLPAGTTLAPQTNITFINVIEFNVIP
jgi:hypothetical protein